MIWECAFFLRFIKHHENKTSRVVNKITPTKLNLSKNIKSLQEHLLNMMVNKNNKFDIWISDEGCVISSLHKLVVLHLHTTKPWTVANTTISATDGLRPSPSSTDFWDKSWFRLSSKACCFPSLPAKSLENFTHFITYEWRKRKACYMR